MVMRQRCGSILVLGALMACLAGTAVAAGQAASSGYHEFTMTAKNYEFDPGVITVKKGEKVRLFITATDRDHGIKIQGYDIDQVLKKGSTATIEFTASKAGTFEFKCSVYCGMGHHKMKGKLVVEEP
jgi:cytochrome c oxidase subunit 2